MNLKHIVVTGATGFVGRNLVSKLLESGYDVTAIIRPNSKNKNSLPFSRNLKIIEESMSNYKNLDKAIVNCHCVFSLAWNGVWEDQRNDKVIQEKNYMHSLDLLYASQRMGCKVFFSAGSQAEYGIVYGKITELTPCNPVTWYGKYKLKLFEEASNICEQMNIKFIEPRFFSLYGPGDYEKTLINTMIIKLINNKDCELTQCIQMWNYLYIYDAIDALIGLLNSNCESGVFNIASESSYPLRYFIEILYEVTKSKSNLYYGKIDYPNSGITNINVDVIKLKMAINWKEKFSFKDGVKSIITA